jgi:sulfate/thiosulfate transport system ATP-binding protein
MGIEVRNIHKRFGNFVALDNVSLNFQTGKLVALLGPSGCGKTTLLRIIAGLEQPDSGRVFLEGDDASGTHVRERQVGFVFQHYALFKHMTVFDNVAFGMRMKPRAERPSPEQIKDKVHQLLHLVQLDWLADRFPAQLSGGQRQRIALARALAVEPRVLLLDEPFGALDAKVRKELRRWLRKLHDELHITSVFVTHDQEEALEVADEVVLMNHGHVEQVGTPDAVYSKPASPFVYSFLGSVNRFDGVVQDGQLLIAGGQQIPLPDPSFISGQTVQSFVRPHDLDILTDPARPGGIAAKVVRILSFGVTVRLELDGLGELASQHYEVELTPGQMQALGVYEGQQVRLLPRQSKTFAATAAPGQAA